ncbi:unnamed protein product [Calypogeia fissa]
MTALAISKRLWANWDSRLWRPSEQLIGSRPVSAPVPRDIGLRTRALRTENSFIRESPHFAREFRRKCQQKGVVQTSESGEVQTPDQGAAWKGSVERVSGEWDGYGGANLNFSGEPSELPSRRKDTGSGDSRQGEGIPKGGLESQDRRPAVALDIDEQAKLFLEEERELLTAMVDFVQAASPEMEEISFLRAALRQLDELFLLVVVGEFNSGKSSVINALLGKRFVKEGVLPTTNEVTLLRHTGDGNEGGERVQQHPDGHYLHYIPADLLKQMNLVDTPGTNVIFQRQQKLTEDFVPRADLVLFVLSVDRPLTKSEVTFLHYIRQWGKKIIFILNKADVLSQRSDLEEVIAFVKENAQSLLEVEEAVVYPVSARLAILAKAAVTTEAGVLDKELLKGDTYWNNSGFGELEDFIWNFLEGTSDAGAERLRLKLDTPLGVGTALLSACDGQLADAIVKADTDLRVLDQIDEQLVMYQKSVQADAALQRQRTTEVVAAAKSRAGKFVDLTLRLSNIEDMLKYLVGSDRAGILPVSREFDQQVIGSSKSDVQKVLDEHAAWLLSNSERQTNVYTELVRSRWPDLSSDTKESTANGSQPSFQSYKEDRQKTNSNSTAVLEGFDVRAAEILLEQEIREVALSTFGGLGIAGISASVLTSVLPNTQDDLIALAVCSAGGFVGVWNLPSRRQDIKNKISKVADGMGRKLGEAMEADLQQNLHQLSEDIRSLTAPYRKAAEAERIRVIALQSRLGEIDCLLRDLRQKVQKLGR